jgi:putative CocE/NonD family hydrolase
MGIAPSVAPLNIGYDVYFPGGVIWAEFTKFFGRLGWDIYGQLIQHPVKDRYWKMLETTTFLEAGDIRVPNLIVCGWHDLYTDEVIATFEEIRTRGGDQARAHSNLIMGPWLHSYVDMERQGELDYPGAVGYANNKTIEFFDHWLRGIDNGFDEQAPIAYYQMGSDQWRFTDGWPPEATTATPYYLHDDGAVSTAAPEENIEPSSFRFNPANPAPTVGGAVLDISLKEGPHDQAFGLAFRPDVLRFMTPVLEEALEISGPVQARLFVSSDRTDTDFTAVLVDVYPDRRQMLVRDGILRMRFRNGTDREELMEPGTVYQVTIDIGNTAITFPEGHRVGVLISSSNYPKYDVNLNDGGPMYTSGEGQIATNSVYHDAEHPSVLVLPVVSRQ